MKRLFAFFLTLLTFQSFAQSNFQQLFKDCHLEGSTTVYDYKKKQWTITDGNDSRKLTQPASTFKVINLLIALETGTIADENAIVKWPGKTDTTLYGYRPEIYKDISVKEAFEVSAGWAFIELAKKVGRDKYAYYLKKAGYGNGNLTEKGDDFWNFGPFGVSPRNQVEFLVKVYEGKTPFSKRNVEILKRVMLTEDTADHKLRSKTGWTRVEGTDIGWWVGYVERKDNVWFFATRVSKPRATPNPDFGNCRKTITKAVLKELGAL
ncbi:beta-lactamase class D [Dyadobacter soli]|uniref:beta-lactamase n=1 Tax=Dyadobacter soli TaxID=659014 RepID=A0A1G7RVP7_9BACT|nr:penicillin-binding transpeptidase domain-containing protein [Dyadobacter soli]SDG14806.1 beta-lactamase class D [Dyadobacter soli]